MSDEDTKRIDVSSTAVEKGIDIAKGFVDKLVLPPIEELGLLVKDRISYWRFNNQIRILTKAKLICEKHGISVKAIPPKLLCPYLENASLEDDDILQDKWAILLSNMVDSEQNIQNHVFPYILGQLSKNEFTLLEAVFIEKNRRVSELKKKLREFLRNRSSIEDQLKEKLREVESSLKALCPDGKIDFSSEAMKMRSSQRSLKKEIASLNFKEKMLEAHIAAPEPIPEQALKEFEIANIIRLGLAKVIYEATAGPHSIEVPIDELDSYASVDFDIEIETDTSTILTELGELFVEACQEKHT